MSVLLGVFPLLARKDVDLMKKSQRLKDFSKLDSFDYNIVVLGAGSAGLVSAYIAAFMLAEHILAMKNGLGLNKIIGTIHPSPTRDEANKMAAGE